MDNFETHLIMIHNVYIFEKIYLSSLHKTEIEYEITRFNGLPQARMGYMSGHWKRRNKWIKT